LVCAITKIGQINSSMMAFFIERMLFIV